MSIWVLAALLTLVCCVALFYAGRKGTVNGGESEVLKARVNVYKSQLGEIDRDVKAGTISATEAEVARAELGRELLRQSAESDAKSAKEGDADQSAKAATSRFHTAALIAGIGFTIVVGGAGYAVLGQPQMLDLQLADRPDAAAALEVADAIVKVEERLARVPDDLRGWQVIAPIYLAQQRYDEAVNAFRRVVELSGPTADNETDLAEAIGAAAGGIFSTDAVALLRSAANRDPAHIRSRFYLAAHATETGDYATAFQLWSTLIDMAPNDAPWMNTAIEGKTFAQAELASLGGAGETGATAASVEQSPGPDAAEIAAAGQLSANQRASMVEEMVARLDQRLHSEGGTAAEWARLVRSRTVLGQSDLARQDAASARVALTNGSDRAAFEELIAELVTELQASNPEAAQ
jgi:cytochrome c-type biogenesis protein CcmH